MTPPLEKSVNKGDIINRLIDRFNFKSFLEYNKFDGKNFYENILCEEKEIAYQPEESYLDGHNLKRLLAAAEGADIDRILPLDRLLTRFKNRKFDIIFFDPIHIRPEVDLCLQKLPQLLNPGGILVVHDCNPEYIELTSVKRRPGAWTGETFKAFALFRHFNREQTITVSEDFGVGLIWNKDLNLDYQVEWDIDYKDFSQDKVEYIGLIDFRTFLGRTASASPDALFWQTNKRKAIRLSSCNFSSIGQPNLRALAHQPPDSSIEAQLFWRTDLNIEEYTASCSLAQSYSSNKEAELNFTLRPLRHSLKDIRFDFADRQCTIMLHAIQICMPCGTVIWDLEQDPTLLINPRQTFIFQSTSVKTDIYLHSTGDDPHINFALPPLLLQEIGEGWKIRIRLSTLPQCLHDFLSEILCMQHSSKTDQPVLLSNNQSLILAEFYTMQKRLQDVKEHMENFDRMLVEWRKSPF